MQLNQHGEALDLYGQLAKDFQMDFLLDEYGRAAAAAGEYDLAGQIWEKILSAEPKSAAVLLRIAGEYAKIWQFAKARALSQQAAELEPGNFSVQLNLASLLSRSGGAAEARVAIDRCLGLDPRHEQARCLSAHLNVRENKLNEAEQQFRDLLGSDLRDSYAIYFCHSQLARVLDRTERFDEAMVYLRKSKQLASKTINVHEARKVFDERREKVVVKARSFPKNILSTWSESFPPSARNAVPPLAFLGGHARSGTTLLERILDAHPSVAACDESLAFMTIGPLIDVMQPQIPAERLNFVRQRYMNNLTKVLETSADGKTLVDKNPAVTAYLPAFLRAFPELRVLVALRDPRDVLVSCYFEDIVQVTHLSVESLAEHYSSVMDVWLAVREWEGLTWMQTRYEDIVTDLQKEGRRVTEFLGLQWHENQVHFHEKNREKPIFSTANYNNVTKPVYSKSVGRWQAYEKYLGPVLPVLEPYCKEFGYS
jgi:Flp pilus assembly protein TadD